MGKDQKLAARNFLFLAYNPNKYDLEEEKPLVSSTMIFEAKFLKRKKLRIMRKTANSWYVCLQNANSKNCSKILLKTTSCFF